MLALPHRPGAGAPASFLQVAARFGLRGEVLGETSEAVDTRAPEGERVRVCLLELQLDETADPHAVREAAAADEAVTDPRFIF